VVSYSNSIIYTFDENQDHNQNMNIKLLGQGYEATSELSVGKHLIKFLADKKFHLYKVAVMKDPERYIIFIKLYNSI
jgi:hypothetical protein